MKYYFNKTIATISFKEAVEKTKEALQKQGFGVLT